MKLIFRKKYFIDKNLQTKFILYTILLLMVYTLLFVVILFFPYITHLSSDYPLNAQAEAAKMVLSLHTSIWPGLGIVFISLGVLSVFTSHKVAGPIYRLKRFMAEVSAGNVEMDIKFRKRDELHDLAASVNLVIHELRHLVSTLKNDHTTVSSCITDIEQLIEKNQIEDIAGLGLIVKLKALNGEIAQTLGKYSAS